ncbi:hypothetical protein EUTSA_v10026826mg [Eutrema salsugineum]|uniref:peroxidase n=1 Tax=Eutrema salsugineum TaxID=72664 RepID=V4LRM7_EUTSA|nr:hypothetical protein EUTSA_v10026826mg [Eutrema salsugineum]
MILKQWYLVILLEIKIRPGAVLDVGIKGSIGFEGLCNQSGSGKSDPAFEPIYREKMSKLCPNGGDENVTSCMNATSKVFGNQYFKDLFSRRGFLNSDQTLFTSPETREYVKMFGENETEFFMAFAEGMVKMGDLQSKKPGEIRLNCRVVNRKNS